MQERARAKIEVAERAARLNGELEQTITVDELNKTKEELLLERAEYASFDVQAMITLELIDGLESRPYARRFFGDNTTLACYEVDDFFDRTRPEMRTGAIREFDEETVVRYIKDVLVCEDRFQINFKAGVTIEIPWKKRTSSK